jgi:hypothetical protein
MAPVEDVPIGMISIDGKYKPAKVRRELAPQFPYFQAAGGPDGEWQKGEVRTISASVVSSRTVFTLGCIPVRILHEDDRPWIRDPNGMLVV